MMGKVILGVSIYIFLQAIVVAFFMACSKLNDRYDEHEKDIENLES